jgi:signal transduction histidine kinase
MQADHVKDVWVAEDKDLDLELFTDMLRAAGVNNIDLLPAHDRKALVEFIVGQAEDLRKRNRHLKKAAETHRRAKRELQRQIITAERANHHKSQFIADVSHDLRTPLNCIIGFSNLILSSDSPEVSGETREFMRRILEASQHLLKLVDNLLDISSIESGKVSLVTEKLDINELINEQLPSYRLMAQSKHHTLEVELRQARPVNADKHRVIEVLNNLVINAIKYTPEHGWIAISTEQVSDGVTVHVKDSGVGIAPKDIKRIFIPFERAVQSPTYRCTQSFGLGLPISKKLIELHGGSLSVESTCGKGSCFTFTLPYLQSIA